MTLYQLSKTLEERGISVEDVAEVYDIPADAFKTVYEALSAAQILLRIPTKHLKDDWEPEKGAAMNVWFEE